MTQKCFGCSDVVHAGVLQTPDMDDKWICKECESKFYTCEACDTLLNGEEYKEFEVKTGWRKYSKWCVKCVEDDTATCDWCGEITASDYTCSDSRITLCEYCRESRYIECSGCGRFVHNDDSFYCEYCDESTCEGCYCGGHEDPVETLYRDWYDEPQVGDKDKASVIKGDRLIGVEIEAVDGTCDGFDKLDKKIGIASDGSLSGDTTIELQTPPASCDALERLINNATKTLKDNGWSANKSCGLHIHIGTQDIVGDDDKLMRLFATYYAIDPLLFAMVPDNRLTSRYCMPLTKLVDNNSFEEVLGNIGKNVKHMVQKSWYKDPLYDETRQPTDKYNDSRYHGVNFHSLLANGHLEIRHHEGTIDADEIKNWINLHMAIVNWVVSNDFNEKAIRFITKASSISMKRSAIFHHLKLALEIREYVKKRMDEFYKEPKKDGGNGPTGPTGPTDRNGGFDNIATYRDYIDLVRNAGINY